MQAEDGVQGISMRKDHIGVSLLLSDVMKMPRMKGTL